MTRYDVPWLSAAETAAAIKTKQVSPVEVIQAYLERIERLDGSCTRILQSCVMRRWQQPARPSRRCYGVVIWGRCLGCRWR